MSRSPRLRLQSLIQAAAVVLLAASAAHAQPAVQWRVEDGGNGHWYKRVACVGMCSFDEAASIGRSQGGHLAAISSEDERLFVGLLGDPAVGAWTGGVVQNIGCCGCANDGCSLPCLGGSPVWENGEPWFAPLGNYVNCWGGGRYGLVARSIGYYWAPTWVAPLVNEVESLIVEWSADCNNDGIVDYGQILQSELRDTNANGVPDLCECASHPALPACCPGNLNGDSVVDGADLGILLFEWGPSAAASAADLNADGQVNGADLGVLLSAWGSCP